jgi:hypothetical protein
MRVYRYGRLAISCTDSTNTRDVRQWFDVAHGHKLSRRRRDLEWTSRDSRFFDIESLAKPSGEDGSEIEYYVIFEQMISNMSHNGFIYCMCIGKTPNQDEDVLISGAGQYMVTTYMFVTRDE